MEIFFRALTNWAMSQTFSFSLLRVTNQFLPCNAGQLLRFSHNLKLPDTARMWMEDQFVLNILEILQQVFIQLLSFSFSSSVF